MTAGQSVLHGILIVVDLLGLGLAAWLGLLRVTLAPRRGPSWLAGALFWAFAAVFALDLLQLAMPLVPGRPWLPYEALRWLVIPLPLAWLWLMDDLLPVRQEVRLRPLRRVAVVLTLLLLFLAPLTKPWDWLIGDRVPPWSWLLFFPVYMGLILVTIVPAGVLAAQAARPSTDRARRSALAVLTLATGLVAVLAVVRAVAYWRQDAAPALPGDLSLLAATVLLGLAMVLNDVSAGRTSTAAFLFHLAQTVTVALVYIAVVGLAAGALGVPWLVLIPVVLLAVATHWLTDWSNGLFEALFYRAPIQRLRADLRSLTQTLDRERELAPQLRPALARLAGQTDADAVALVIGDGDALSIAAAYPPALEGQPVAADLATQRGPATLGLADDPGRRGWVVPVSGAAGTAAAVLLRPQPGHSVDDRTVTLLDEVAGRLGDLLAGHSAQGERRAAMAALVADYRAGAREIQSRAQTLAEPGAADDADLAALAPGWVEDALRHLHDVGYLGRHPLADLELIGQRLASAGTPVTHLERGQAVRQLCEELVARLRPAGATPAEPYPAEWRLYVVLHAAYVEGQPNREIMARLYIGEGTFQRARRQALDSVAAALVELEHAARAQAVDTR